MESVKYLGTALMGTGEGEGGGRIGKGRSCFGDADVGGPIRVFGNMVGSPVGAEGRKILVDALTNCDYSAFDMSNRLDSKSV